MDQEILGRFMDSGYLVSPDFFQNVKDDSVLEIIKDKILSKEKPLVLCSDLLQNINSADLIEIDWMEFEKSRVLFEKGRNVKAYSSFLDLIKKSAVSRLARKTAITTRPIPKAATENKVNLIKCYKEEPKKRTVSDFVSYFKHRYNFLKNVLSSRPELSNVVSINRLLSKENDPNEVALIGIVYDKQITKNNNLILVLEDLSGSIKVIASRNDLLEQASLTCVDEVIGVKGFLKNRVIYANNILFPDIAANGQQKRCKDEDYVAFISDIHVGSTYFLEDNFLKFIKWINGEEGSEEQRQIAKKLKYVFVIGDLVAGIGVFPGQEEYLIIKDIREQYNKLAEYLRLIRKDVTLIICPGQHDSIRAAEPQPVLDKEYAEALWNLENIILVSNPALVNLFASEDFEGFNVLMYHGASFHYYINNIPLLRQGKARLNPSIILKLLLQKRHLAPSHTSTTYVPSVSEDPLLIDKVPDILVSGDMHKSDISNYNGVITINCSCWEAKTDFQEKTGNEPDPCKVPVFNTKTREIKIIDFS